MCSDAATVTANSLMTCPDVCYQAPRARCCGPGCHELSQERSQVHGACQIRAETKGRGCGPPVFVKVSGLSSAASPVVYKTAHHLTKNELPRAASKVFDAQRRSANSPPRTDRAGE